MRSAVRPTAAGVAPPIVHQVLGEPGRPLDGSTRTFMESRFVHDFSGVRVHTDERATASARAVGARAYTVGEDLVFGSGEFAPHSSVGRRLLAHELAHVVQQGTTFAGAAIEIAPVGDLAEQQAERAAAQVLSGFSPAVVELSSTPAALRRAPDPCLDDCEVKFKTCLDHTRFPPECLARRGTCLDACEAKKKATSKDPEEKREVDIRDVVIESGGKREHVDPKKVPQGIWWLNGGVPTLPVLYPTEVPISTGLPASGSFVYEVTVGADKLALLDRVKPVSKLTLKDSPNVVVRGIGPSKANKDVKVKITHTPPGAKRSAVYSTELEVRAPAQLGNLSCSHAAMGGRGFESEFRATLRDNFGAAMPYMDYNEDFDAGTLASGVSSEWEAPFKARKRGHSLTLGDAGTVDHYSVEVTGGATPKTMTPVPSNPQNPLGSNPVGSFNHRWYAGSPTPGQGVQLSAHVGQLYADHGEYRDFLSPLGAKAKPVSCPPLPGKTP